MQKSASRVFPRLSLVAAALLAATVLSGCDGVKRQLGVGRNSPDEFAVVKRAPLTLPPEYSLRPPSGDILPPASEVTQQARGVLMGNTAGTKAVGGTAEQSFLAQTGAAQADPDIRTAINRDNGYIALQSRTVADKLIFWEEGNDADLSKAPSSVVDAKAEAERLQKNKAEGKPATEGDVPVIEKKKSTLDRIF